MTTCLLSLFLQRAHVFGSTCRLIHLVANCFRREIAVVLRSAPQWLFSGRQKLPTIAFSNWRPPLNEKYFFPIWGGTSAKWKNESSSRDREADGMFFDWSRLNKVPSVLLSQIQYFPPTGGCTSAEWKISFFFLTGGHIFTKWKRWDLQLKNMPSESFRDANVWVKISFFHWNSSLVVRACLRQAT
jgi:hypothetical protein